MFSICDNRKTKLQFQKNKKNRTPLQILYQCGRKPNSDKNQLHKLIYGAREEIKTKMKLRDV